MGALDWFAAKLGYVRPRRATTGYAAADSGRLAASLATEAQFINTTLRYQLRTLRARSRQAAQNNPFARRFSQMVVDNLCGPVPFRLQAKTRLGNGKLDVRANKLIEQQWRAWSRAGRCELTGRWSWAALQRLVVRGLAVDGEVLLRRYRGQQYGAHGFQLQVIDVDRLDDGKNKTLPGGGAIHMGVELDAESRPVAYHILKRKPAEWQITGYVRDTERIAAEDIFHIFVPDFAEQVRGVPWMYAALLNLVHLGAFEEAAVIAARVGASQMGIIQTPDGGATLADTLAKDSSGTPQISVEPGVFQTLPPGYTMADGWNPKYPDAAIEPFVKACLRGIAVGCGVAYHNLSGDMEGVNYSSARIAELDERDSWMTLQEFLAEHLHDRIYADWVGLQPVMGNLPYASGGNPDKYLEVYWQARRWQWVDPEKEVNAAIKANEARLKSRTRIISEQGEDIEDVFDEIAAEEALAEEKDIELGPAEPEPAPAAAPEEPDDAEPDEPAESEAQKAMAADLRALERHVQQLSASAREPHVINVHPAPVTIAEGAVRVQVGAPPAPEVHVAAPTVHVAAPNVEVKAPDVSLEVPEGAFQIAVKAQVADAPKPWPTETKITERDQSGRAKVMETRPLKK